MRWLKQFLMCAALVSMSLGLAPRLHAQQVDVSAVIEDLSRRIENLDGTLTAIQALEVGTNTLAQRAMRTLLKDVVTKNIGLYKEQVQLYRQMKDGNITGGLSYGEYMKRITQLNAQQTVNTRSYTNLVGEVAAKSNSSVLAQISKVAEGAGVVVGTASAFLDLYEGAAAQKSGDYTTAIKAYTDATMGSLTLLSGMSPVTGIGLFIVRKFTDYVDGLTKAMNDANKEAFDARIVELRGIISVDALQERMQRRLTALLAQVPSPSTAQVRTAIQGQFRSAMTFFNSTLDVEESKIRSRILPEGYTWTEAEQGILNYITNTRGDIAEVFASGRAIGDGSRLVDDMVAAYTSSRATLDALIVTPPPQDWQTATVIAKRKALQDRANEQIAYTSAITNLTLALENASPTKQASIKNEIAAKQKLLTDTLPGVRQANADYNDAVKVALANSQSSQPSNTGYPYVGAYSTIRTLPAGSVGNVPTNTAGSIDTVSASDFRATGTMLFESVSTPVKFGNVRITAVDSLTAASSSPSTCGSTPLFCWGTWGNTGHIVTAQGYSWNAQSGWWVVGQASGPDGVQWAKQNLGTATYNGTVRGDLLTFGPGGATSVQSNALGGTANLTANFGSNRIGGSMAIDNTSNGTRWANTSFSGIAISGNGTYSGSMTVSGGSGNIFGAFWGNQAQATGGNWWVMKGTSGSTTSVGNGIFVTKR